MFCNKCEQTAKGTGCTVRGVCGKQPEVAALQNLLVHALRGLSHYAQEGRRVGVVDEEANRFTCEALFTNLTNVNFDPERYRQRMEAVTEHAPRLKEKVRQAGGKADFAFSEDALEPTGSVAELVRKGEELGLPVDPDASEDIRSLQQTLLYGLEGIAAYAYHAHLLGKEDEAVYAFVHEALSSIGDKNLGLDEWIGLVLRCGGINLRAMELLDAGHTERYGHPVPTTVPLGHRKGKCILISGHDLMDLEKLLKQTEGRGIDIYTHGEMLPAHGYPELKKYGHFYGHFGTAWQNQKKEFKAFPGAILMTTNCLQKPADNYRENIFTTGPAGFPEIQHIEGDDYSPVIEKALAMPGFETDGEADAVMTGFARNAIMEVADKVIGAVKSGELKHIFLVAGCDGAKPGRNYYTEFVEKVPEDAVVLTLACGKFRFFDKKLGDIGGIPRLLDVGQCNDTYSAIQVAAALAEAFECDINELPLSMVLSWYEQKAAAILLTLFHLNIKGIRLGPSLPAFVSPNVLDVLVKNFDIKPISTPDEDLAELLQK